MKRAWRQLEILERLRVISVAFTYREYINLFRALVGLRFIRKYNGNQFT